MIEQPRRPIFWFLWPRPDPNAPVDGEYSQVRAVRISPRGPVRLAALVVGAAVEVVVMGTAVLSALGSGLGAFALVGAAVAASGLFLLLRGWVVGTYVTDAVVRIETTFRRQALPWTQVSAIRTQSVTCPFLGLPIPVPASRVMVVDQAGHAVGTHVYTTSPDYWLRAEAFDMAALRLGRWRDPPPFVSR